MRYADTPEARPRWRFNAAYRLTPRFQAGIEYNPVVHEIVPTANWLLNRESARWPLLTLGTSSDRIGSREGTHAYYLTLARGIPRYHVAPYVSLNYSEQDRGVNFPFGVNIALGGQWDLLPMNDGRRSHLLLTYKEKNWNVSLIAVYLKHPGVSIGFAF
ncbi:MAG TPA: hypothetical protein VFB21_05075 [Chthonomonadaceae bacterium]|nr:hypothetical protein [Chthonomonadaceae bacterium]